MRYWPMCLLIAFLLSKPVLAAAVTVSTLDEPETRQQILANLAPKHPGTVSAFEEISTKSRPFVIFIPGILGSGLKVKDTDEVIWGKSQLTNVPNIARKLAFCADVEIDPYILNEFEIAGGPTNQPVYGEWLTRLKEATATVGAEYKIFAYDWREDIKKIATKFDDFIKRIGVDKLRKRPVIFVAHSMGGLVLSWWYHNHFLKMDDDRKFAIAKTMFLGTPHAGAASMMKVLMLGYERNWPNPFLSFFADYKKHFVKALNRVAHTFPSLYQLLPHPDEKFIRYDDGKGDPILENHFDINIWIKYKLLSRSLADKSYCQDSMNDRNNLLKAGKKFYDDLYILYDKQGVMPRASYYFSQIENSTPSLLEIDGNYEREWKNGVGDERVVPRSATFPSMLYSKGDPHTLAYESEVHGGLLNNRSFVGDFEFLLNGFISRRDQAIFRLSRDPQFQELKMVLEELSVVFLFPEEATSKKGNDASKKIASVVRDFRKLEYQEVFKHNLKILNKGEPIQLTSSRAGQLLFDLAWTWKNKNASKTRARRRQLYRLLASGKVAVPEAHRAEVSNGLVHMAIEDKNVDLGSSWQTFTQPLMLAKPEGKVQNELVKAFQNNTKWLNYRKGMVGFGR